ncbi:MAG: ribosomal protein S18-alanine N-acetyltransferase [Gammaproteobacteria bacterium]|nr:ribosomal protein S18-alanine N-acetyltransferase [Gammaproteobacteria bacterium]MDD9896184.1 ribosomal protein S18-alanine N-acetyltransferase [Gammaproteobacteria bacterium]MDD9959002.1 ribosomal protein S18-alanine N-acetyltransferase [Gammaproteobacteria bacterium]
MLSPSDSKQQFFARNMRYSDVDMVVQNEAMAYEHPWTKRIFIDCLRAGYQCWVLANKQKIVAHGVMSVAIGECHLLTLCVHPEFQRYGYGRKIFNLLLDRAYKLDASECFLEVRAGNGAAITLYKSMGFAVIGERKNYYPGKESREDALIMSRSLPIP